MSITYPAGFRTGTAIAHRPGGSQRRNLALVVNSGPMDTAVGVFTPNRFRAAPVVWTSRILEEGHAGAVVINSGNANACTGPEGLDQARAMAERTGEQLGLPAEQVAVCSTGIIGHLLHLDSILTGIDQAAQGLSASQEAGEEAAKAILTTDTCTKTVAVDGSGWRLGGMVKGSGMIAPQLATMICVITTDAILEPEQARQALSEACRLSFNRIDVDGCMSTNDTVLLMASGASGVRPDPGQFQEKLGHACADLAHRIVADGEGSRHRIRIRVDGAESEDAALACARAVSGSTLLKCAVAGEDPNWGRVVSSLGTVPVSTAAYDSAHVDVSFNGIKVCQGGRPGQDPELVDLHVPEVHIDIDLGQGDSQATVWTDDLTHEYVTINADYHT